MKKTGKKLRPRKVYSEAFRKARVKEYESGEFSVLEICNLYDLPNGSVYNWIHKYSTYNKKGYKIVEMSSSSTQKLKDKDARIAELERLLGQKQIKIDYLEELIELAEEQYDVQFKKNSNTPRSK